ncbi:MAG: hypothetical protein ACJARD_000658 [Alphaproteobacteria bacterium]|jgi:hypothetical protein
MKLKLILATMVTSGISNTQARSGARNCESTVLVGDNKSLMCITKNKSAKASQSGPSNFHLNATTDLILMECYQKRGAPSELYDLFYQKGNLNSLDITSTKDLEVLDIPNAQGIRTDINSTSVFQACHGWPTQEDYKDLLSAHKKFFNQTAIRNRDEL